MKVVICGAGVIGSSVAYHLAELNVASTVVERCSVACAASGKAGGFLARDWCDSTPLQELARKSFKMHEQLAKTLPGLAQHYRKLNTIAIHASEGKSKSVRNIPSWIDGPINRSDVIGSTKTTAQVHPFILTNAYLQAAKQKTNTQVKFATVTGIVFSDDGTKVSGVEIKSGEDTEVLEADVVVIAMGPWSDKARQWFKHCAPISANRAHSILLKPKTQGVTADALFVEFTHKNGHTRDPEFYPRPDGEFYICGMSDNQPLPEDPAQVSPNMESCETLKNIASCVSSKLSSADHTASQACYLPGTPDGIPMIGAIPGVQGAYIATGHSCWGILNSPATGAALAQLIVHGQSEIIDLSVFDPSRFV